MLIPNDMSLAELRLDSHLAKVKQFVRRTLTAALSPIAKP
jgi:hypothetical protein